MTLALKLKELRVKHGESLQEVANAVGASKAYIWTLESAKPANPTVEFLKRLADHFNVSVSYLFGEGPGERVEQSQDQLLRMFRNLGELSERDRAVIDDIIKGMKKRSPEG